MCVCVCVHTHTHTGVSQKFCNISISVHKAKLIEVLIDCALWRTKLCWQCTSTCVWLLFNYFKQSLLSYSRKSFWPWFVFETAVTFLERSEPNLFHAFVDSSWAFNNIYFCQCPYTQSFLSKSKVKWFKLEFFYNLLKVQNKE